MYRVGSLLVQYRSIDLLMLYNEDGNGRIKNTKKQKQKI